MRKVVILWLPKASGVIGVLILQPKKTTITTSTSEFLPSISSKATSTIDAAGGTGVMPQPFASIPSTASLPELVKKFGQIRTRMRSPRCPSELLKPPGSTPSLQGVDAERLRGLF